MHKKTRRSRPLQDDDEPSTPNFLCVSVSVSVSLRAASHVLAPRQRLATRVLDASSPILILAAGEDDCAS